MAELQVGKKNISKLLADMQGRKFIIPDYQRPYKWDIEKCGILWNDIEAFSASEALTGVDYFLGTIVSFNNENNNSEIIDGQQRITSFFLMLRAFYKKLEDMKEDEDVIGLKNQIAPCIWDINEMSQKVSDRTKIHIVSEVATEDDNNIFHSILETGLTDEKQFDNYSCNYRFFKEQCDKYAENNPMQWKKFCVTILRKCIVLPIECERQETALTIFSTLNDRGLPLADSDIFKAQIYKFLQTAEERKEFTNLWKELTSTCKQAYITIDDVFRYYTHVLRARENDKTKEVGLRNFYSQDSYAKLKKPDLIEDIVSLADFWHAINSDNGWEKESPDYLIDKEAWKYLHCLANYSNEYWKYAVSVYYLKNRGKSFSTGFACFLRELTAFLFAKFIEFPTVNAIKDDIYQAGINIQQNNKLDLEYTLPEEFRNRIQNHASSKLSRGLLLLHAYHHPDQKETITWGFDIEHIFPQKWQEANYNGWEEMDAQEYLNRFGNKIVFEKRLNIQAGNGYFGKKKKKYIESEIAAVRQLGNYSKNDWVKSDIEQREEVFKDDLMGFFQKYLLMQKR
jgi:uncharacterized protein with ParB-like and HNH nuclease domain